MQLYKIKKELDIDYKDIYEACDELGIELKKRHHSTSLDEESVQLLMDHFRDADDDKGSKRKSSSKSGRKPPKPKLIKDGEIVINADVEAEKTEEFIDLSEEDELDIIERETGRKFSKEERHRRKQAKQTKEEEIASKKERKRKKDEEEKQQQTSDIKILTIPEYIPVKDFAELMGVGQNEIVKKLMMLGVTNVAQPLDFDVATIIAEDFDILLEMEEDTSAEALEPKGDLRERPPVVTIMGHVDHGKTTLLDNIRKSNVAARESGGITQHIGAYQITWNKKKITFIDTPGHEAFTEMRAHGANVTDIAIIVIAADDGIKPQTEEAIAHAKAAEVPIIVAINKIDRPGANIDKVKQELASHGLNPEDWGGDTICVPLSAKTGENIEDLLEMILLVTEMEELKAEHDVPAQGVVIESYKHKGKGPVATVLVQKGILDQGNIVVSGVVYGKVRAMHDEYGKRVQRAEAAKPVEIMGLSDVPQSGGTFKVVANEKLAREITQKHIEKLKKESMGSRSKSLEELLSAAADDEKKKLSIILKTDVRGTCIALKESLDKLTDEEINVNVIHSGVGIVSETDVNLAVASNALIIGFNVRAGGNARKLAEKEGIEIRLYKIIYEAIEDVSKIVKGMYDKRYQDVVIGQATVLQTFKVPKIGMIAGCKVEQGVVKRKSNVKLIRDGIEIYESNLSSLKRFKDDVAEVAQGYECGIGIESFNDLKEGDILEIIEEQEEER